jgi:hypothetical protein
MKAIVMPNPSAECYRVTEQGFHKWNLPNCIRSIEGKYVMIKAPRRSGFLYFNYKKYFSIVLLELVDANYKFIVVDVGAYGSCFDGGLFTKFIFGCIEERLTPTATTQASAWNRRANASYYITR